MIYKIFSVYDTKIEAYMPPLYMRTRGEAIRAVTSAVGDDNHQFSKNTADYALFELGDWDDNTGRFSCHEAPVSLGVLIEFASKS